MSEVRFKRSEVNWAERSERSEVQLYKKKKIEFELSEAKFE